MKRNVMVLASSLLASVGSVSAARLPFDAPYEHLVYERISLNGTWEMAYRPYDWTWEAHELPVFRGVMVNDAVPGYWEDMTDSFRAAGMKDVFRLNPLWTPQSYPISGRATDTTLPDIRGCFLYRRKVMLSDVSSKAVLAFEGVRNRVHLWVNGIFVTARAGFSTSFELKIPAGVLRKGANEIILAVSNDPNLGYCGAHVSGLTTRALFASTGGINGSLELRFLKSKVSDVYVTTAEDLASFTVHVDSAGETFAWRILQGTQEKESGTAKGDFTRPAQGYVFWSPNAPNLYTLEITAQGRKASRTFGLRRLVAQGEKLFLNNQPIYLCGITEHAYFPKTVHLPRDAAYWRMVTNKRKELGFNFVRFHTFVPPKEYLEATDALGMLVHIESPNFVSEPEWTSIVAFARQHPSVVIYCTGNETRIDRLAETYLADVADIVHKHTDALFSPMSALRGVEYYFMPHVEKVVEKPFAHNPERLNRLLPFTDLFTSFQMSVTSYESLNFGTPEDLDAWGDVYGGKPRLSHEICINGSYADLSLEKLYPPDSPILKAGIFSGIRRHLTERGLIDRADAYFRNSCEWMWRIRKHCFEKMRRANRVAGFDFLGDINTHWHTFGYSVGMMDEFYRLKPGETVRSVRYYNGPSVLLSDFGSDFNVVAGTTKRVNLLISNYEAPVRKGRLVLSLLDPAGKAVYSTQSTLADIPNGQVSALAKAPFEIAIPSGDVPCAYRLFAYFSSEKVTSENMWELYAFPKQSPMSVPQSVQVLPATASEGDLLAALEKGKDARVVLFGKGPFKALKTSFMIGLAGRCTGNYATIIKPGHPLFATMPHAGYCGWQFRRLMEEGQAIQLEAGVPFDPVVDIASAVKFPIRQALLFEYKVGKGKLLVSGFNFDNSDPASVWLKNRILAYAASSEFKPAQSLSKEALHALVTAPLLSGARDTNRARNPNDAASAIRAGVLAQP